MFQLIKLTYKKKFVFREWNLKCAQLTEQINKYENDT